MERSAEYYVTKAFGVLTDGMAALIFLVCFAYAGYTLWDTWNVLEEPSALQGQLEPYKPKDTEDLTYSFEQLMALNPDVCAWITIDNTEIDYPVVQGEDDFAYLSKDVLGEPSAAGSIFLECENSRNFTDFYSILMGHHMQGGKMFGNIDLFTEESFFRENDTGTLYLPDRILSLETAAILSADAYDRYLYRVDWDTEEGKEELLSQIEQKALFTRGDPLTAKEQIIALSTCSSDYTNARHLLICRVTGERYAEKGSGR